ncbi:MAG TPA: DNA primase, partial [Streptomyces sp.]|nr:DNA primase [Streptomyces sp.]
TPQRKAERELLKVALQFPHLVSPLFDAYGADEFTAAPYAVVRQAIEKAGGVERADREYLTRVREAAPDDTVRSLITELSVEPLMTPREPDEAYAGELLVKVRLEAVNRRIAELRSTFERLVSSGDESQTAVSQELWTLERYGRALRDRGAAALWS